MLYTFNNKLLSVNGELAGHEQCCCCPEEENIRGYCGSGIEDLRRVKLTLTITGLQNAIVQPGGSNFLRVAACVPANYAISSQTISGIAGWNDTYELITTWPLNNTLGPPSGPLHAPVYNPVPIIERQFDNKFITLNYSGTGTYNKAFGCPPPDHPNPNVCVFNADMVGGICWSTTSIPHNPVTGGIFRANIFGESSGFNFINDGTSSVPTCVGNVITLPPPDVHGIVLGGTSTWTWSFV